MKQIRKEIADVDAFVEKLPPYTAIFFIGKHCPACPMIKKTAERLYSYLKEANGVQFMLCDVAIEQELPRSCGITSIPSFAVFLNNHFVKSYAGILEEEDILDILLNDWKLAVDDIIPSEPADDPDDEEEFTFEDEEL